MCGWKCSQLLMNGHICPETHPTQTTIPIHTHHTNALTTTPTHNHHHRYLNEQPSSWLSRHSNVGLTVALRDSTCKPNRLGVTQMIRAMAEWSSKGGMAQGMFVCRVLIVALSLALTRVIQLPLIACMLVSCVCFKPTSLSNPRSCLCAGAAGEGNSSMMSARGATPSDVGLDTNNSWQQMSPFAREGKQQEGNHTAQSSAGPSFADFSFHKADSASHLNNAGHSSVELAPLHLPQADTQSDAAEKAKQQPSHQDAGESRLLCC